MIYTLNEKIFENKTQSKKGPVSFRGSYARIMEIQLRAEENYRRSQLKNIDGIHLA